MHPDFEKNGYIIARNFFDETTIALLQIYFDLKYRVINYSEQNRMEAVRSYIQAGEDVATSFTFYSDYLTESIQLKYGQKASNIVKMRLSPTYTYARIYEKNNFLIPHVDRPSCEVSATCPIMISDNSPSIICISNYSIDKTTQPYKIPYKEIEERGDYTEVSLLPGDALFYRGCERFHWRKPLHCDSLTQFFMHFVETEGVHKEWYFDKRPYSGFPSEYKYNNVPIIV
jgi:hypothetical protein